jgi:hypothetical protein
MSSAIITSALGPPSFRKRTRRRAPVTRVVRIELDGTRKTDPQAARMGEGSDRGGVGSVKADDELVVRAREVCSPWGVPRLRLGGTVPERRVRSAYRELHSSEKGTKGATRGQRPSLPSSHTSCTSQSPPFQATLHSHLPTRGPLPLDSHPATLDPTLGGLTCTS